MRRTYIRLCVGTAAGAAAASPLQASSVAARVCPTSSWHAMRGAHDICFYYPRYKVETHLPDALPELTAVKKALYEGDAAGDSVDRLRRNVRSLLRRANEVFTNASGGDILSQNGAAPSVRGFAVAVAAAVAATEQPVRHKYADFKLCVTLAPALRAIARDASTHATPHGFDAACFCVAAYTRAMTNQLLRGAWHDREELCAATGESPAAGSTLATPAEAIDAVSALQMSCMTHARQSNEEDAPSFRSAYNKLTALLALLQLAHNNDASAAIDLITPLLRLSGVNEVEKRVIDTLRCELMQRSYGHSWGRDAVDSEVEAAYHRCAEGYWQYFKPQTPEGAVEMDPRQWTLMRDAFSMHSLSMAAMYQEIPRLDDMQQSFRAGSVQGHPHSRLSVSPFIHVPCAQTDESQIVRLRTSGACIPCAAVRAKKLATAYADRSLRINRKLFPDQRNNVRAAVALRSLSICFTDVRDYLYASGMFNSALRTHEALYGKLSEEYLEVLALSGHMQLLLKNDKEAIATSTLLAALTKEFNEKALVSFD